MAKYQIIESVESVDRVFMFWKTVKTLTFDSRVFKLVTLKSNETPTVANDWTHSEEASENNSKVLIKANEAVNKVVDNLGNVYYEVE